MNAPSLQTIALLTIAFVIYRYTYSLGFPADPMEPSYLNLQESCGIKGQLALGNFVIGIKEAKECDCL